MSASGSDWIGRTVASCKIRSKLGQGAMGSVYLAEQEALHRVVALKVLDARHSSEPSYRQRFIDEAQAAAQLTDPHIVQVLDSGEERGCFYIINEFVDGMTIKQLLDKNGPLAVDRALDIVLQAAQGLSAAMDKNILHRDIKPENLMIAKDGTVKIADFGLAKILETDSGITREGLIMGTPFYMSPEQARGQKLDVRTDIYSLGVTFYHMLVGRIPFDADSVIGVLLKQISAERPDPCAEKPEIPPAVGDLVMRMMACEAADRPEDPSALAREIEALQRRFAAPAAPADLAEAAELSEDHRAAFKPLPRVIRVTRLDVSEDALSRMIMTLPGDGGFYIESDAPLPPNSAVEVRFALPGKDDEFMGVGLVRWSSATPPMKGMGVTFVGQVQAVPRGGAAKAGGEDVRLSGPMAINALTQSALHQRLLRFVYSNAGQTMPLANVAGSLGCGVRMLEEPVRTFERAGMAQRLENGRLVELKWPDDEALQREVIAWIGRNGLT